MPPVQPVDKTQARSGKRNAGPEPPVKENSTIPAASRGGARGGRGGRRGDASGNDAGMSDAPAIGDCVDTSAYVSFAKLGLSYIRCVVRRSRAKSFSQQCAMVQGLKIKTDQPTKRRDPIDPVVGTKSQLSLRMY